MSERIDRHGLKVARNLDRFIENEVLPGTGVDGERFWQGFAALVDDLTPKNRALLAERDRLQQELDAWHRAHPGPIADIAGYRRIPRTYRVSGPAAGPCPGDHGERRPRDCRTGRPATRGADVQCALCAECGECPLGQLVRRVVRHRRDPRNRRRRERSGVQRGPRPRRHCARARLSRSGGTARRRFACGRHRLSGARRPVAGGNEGRATPTRASGAVSSAIKASPMRLRRCC